MEKEYMVLFLKGDERKNWESFDLKTKKRARRTVVVGEISSLAHEA
jgi:hypothetical protein